MSKKGSKLQYHSVFISDTHLGSRYCKDKCLLEFLSSINVENLYLVGDIIDVWSFSRRYVWNKTQTEILRKILKISEKSSVFYIPGNHDEMVRKLLSHSNGYEFFGSIYIQDEIIINSKDGRTILVTHGDQFDWAMKIPHFVLNFFDRIVDFFPKEKISSFLKEFNRITSVEYIAKKYVKNNQKIDAILMGHTHIPKLDIEYINTGDWVKSCSYVVENLDGTWELKFF